LKVIRIKADQKLGKMREVCGAVSLGEVNKAIRWNAVWEKNRRDREGESSWMLRSVANRGPHTSGAQAASNDTESKEARGNVSKSVFRNVTSIELY
jgi:hypothetical protein